MLCWCYDKNRLWKIPKVTKRGVFDAGNKRAKPNTPYAYYKNGLASRLAIEKTYRGRLPLNLKLETWCMWKKIIGWCDLNIFEIRQAWYPKVRIKSEIDDSSGEKIIQYFGLTHSKLFSHIVVRMRLIGRCNCKKA